MISRAEGVRVFPPRLGAAVAVAIAALAFVPRARAQDTHYWSIQYGPVGQLVGGQLIGGVSDPSATFYNPGALPLRDSSPYLLSTESAQWEGLSTDAEPGLEVYDTKSSRFGAAPSLIAGVLPRWLGPKTPLAWSFLTRQKFDLRLSTRLTNPTPAPGVRSAAESYADQQVREDWGGLTIAHAVSPAVGIGATWYVVHRGQRTRKELSLQEVDADGSGIVASGVTDFDYSHVRTLVKLGVAWHTTHWNAGVSVTTPSAGLFGNANAGYTVSIVGMDTNGDANADPAFLSTQTYEDLDCDWDSPWTFGAGLSSRVGRTRLYTSAEWYLAVPAFDVIQPPQGPDGPVALLPAGGANAGLRQELRSVLNAGAGFEHVFSPDVSLYGAFRTDFSAATGRPGSGVAVTDWNLYHVSGGVSFRVQGNRFTLGGSWATGRTTRPVDSPIPPENLPGSGLDREVSVRYEKLTFLLGFVFGS